MKGKKTIKVEEIKESINDILLNTGNDKTETRQAVMSMLEDILHQTGNYKGFCYLNAFDMEKSREGYSVGINYGNNGEPADMDTRFKNTDRTRVRFF